MPWPGPCMMKRLCASRGSYYRRRQRMDDERRTTRRGDASAFTILQIIFVFAKSFLRVFLFSTLSLSLFHNFSHKFSFYFCLIFLYFYCVYFYLYPLYNAGVQTRRIFILFYVYISMFRRHPFDIYGSPNLCVS